MSGHDLGADPVAALGRAERLSIHRAWFEESVYSRADAGSLYPLRDGDNLRLRVPTARLITNKHLGLEISRPPQFKLGNERAQKWLTRTLKLNGLRGAMRAAAVTKSWAGDVGLLFAYKPTEREVFGTPWQVGFIEPETYDVFSRYPSGVFREVDVYSFEDLWDEQARRSRRWWKRTRYSRENVTTWPLVEGALATTERPPVGAFDEQARQRPDEVRPAPNSLGVIPFVLIQNVSGGTQDWQGVSDYQFLTHLFHRLNVHLDSVEQGEQVRNKLMLALIDAEEVDVKLANGIAALDIKSNEDGTTDRQAQIMPTPLMNGGTQLQFFSNLLDLTMEAAGVAQTGSARELFGNEAASSSALRTFYAMQTAVATHKRENWKGERVDYGLSGFVRKLLTAARRVDPGGPGLSSETDLEADEFELDLDWPDMFALSAPEQQTLASVAQQAHDDGLPPEVVAPVWGRVLGAGSLKEQRAISDALQRRQDRVSAGLISPPPPKRGILGSGQGDGLGDDGGSVTAVVTP